MKMDMAHGVSVWDSLHDTGNVVTMHYSTELSRGGSKPVTIVGMLPRLTNVQTDPPFQISRYNF
jgi:hypothetical protein